MDNKLIYNSLYIYILIFSVTSCSSLIDYEGVFYTKGSVNDRFEQSMQWNETNSFKEIETTTDDYTMYFMADSHVGGTRNFDKIITTAKINAVQAVVMVGDISSGFDQDFDTLKKHLPANNLIQTFQIPGNHDLYFAGWEKYFELFGASTYYFSITTPSASDLFICLDSGSCTLGSKQIEWLKNILNTLRSNFRHCIVLSHNHLFRSSNEGVTTPPTEELSYLFNLFSKYNVNMYFNGHNHSKSVKVLGKTTYVTIGACTDTDLTPNYVKFHQLNGRINHEFVKVK